jgi:DNA-binding PadR family transcriptional regulator
MAVREGLLTLLAERPRHGYELKAAFEASTGELWRLNTGQIYTTLERLERDGLVEPDPGAGDDERRRPYRLTGAGRAEVEAWLRAPIGSDSPPRDELVMKVLLAARRDPATALSLIDAQRHQMLSTLHDLRRDQRAGDDDLAARLVADAQAVRVEADLRWLDLCVDRLSGGRSTR